MPRSALRRALAMALVVAVAAVTSACERKPEGAVKVVVIGETPKVVDPAAGPLSPGEALLLTNVAQGLVRFDARGQIEPGLAERWNVSNDGLSYIFRMAAGEWPSGDRITAHQVARLLRRTIAASSNSPLKDTLGAVDEIVAMTDRVLEIRLKAPRPNLLQLLAQPEFALVREDEGSGPFRIAHGGPAGVIRLERQVTALDGEEGRTEQLWLGGSDAPTAVRAFVAGEADLVLGGTFADLPYARRVQLPRGALRFDPVAGLFGLAPARSGGPLADPELRRLLSQAIDRDALIEALGVPGLVGRATLLEAGLDGVPDPVTPEWLTVPIGERRPGLIAASDRVFGAEERPVLRIALPEGPGAQLLFNRIASDWALLGIKLERSAPGQPTDLKLVDAVAPSTSPAWFLRRFRCGTAPICDEQIDPLLEAARAAPVAAQRGALLAEAARLMDENQLFIPIAAPVRWALVSDRVTGFAGNRFARHTLTSLEERLNREGAQ
ncbi:ABC transporter substrate-binding protein [Sphingomonas sp.]|uniref:ABC transporter substrate-binding protein n=1 Tax=Sphingomonas sp. TaxID=28214 RepID=UPI0017FF5294|nr:ABC transporter substrate-binding protein [Sphingomonas sp.]MBA3512204.1 ABC transporter substrate-binding protein [Sphingomonas sp.]